MKCAVVGCHNNFSSPEERDFSYFSFPKDLFLRNIWVRACSRPSNWEVSDSSLVCSDHFDSDDFNYSELPNGETMMTLKSGSVPSSRSRVSIKAEPIDVEEEFRDDLDDELNASIDEGERSYSPVGCDVEQDASTVESSYERYSCTVCGREFKTRIRLKRHALFCQPPNERKKKINAGPRSGAGTACLYSNCSAKFYHRNRMLKHMATVHNYSVNEMKSFVFPTMEDFWTWKENEEERTYSYFSKRTGNHKNSATYHCQRDGPTRSRKSQSDSRTNKRHVSRGSIKANIVCLAHIKTTLNEDGSVSALYFPSHNHPLSAMDFLHHPLSRATQLFIKEKLELGYSPKQIADELLTRQNASSQAGANTMTKNQFLHMVNKLDRIRGFLDRERKRARDEGSGQVPPRQRKSRKAILEEQFEKSRRFLEISRTSEVDEEEEQDGKKLESNDDVSVGFQQVISSADEEIQLHDDENMSDNDENPCETASIDVGAGVDDGNTSDDAEEQEDNDLISARIEDERIVASSPFNSEKDFETLYKETLIQNSKLAETVVVLKKQVAKKDRQINLLINALKRSLSKDCDDMSSVIDTVTEGDYQIVVI